MDSSRFLRGPSQATLRSNFDEDSGEVSSRSPSRAISTVGSLAGNTASRFVTAPSIKHGHTVLKTGQTKETSQAGADKDAERPGLPSSQAILKNPTAGGNKIFGKKDPASEGKDSVNKDILQTVRKTFMDADEDGSGKLAPDEFIGAFTGILQTEDGGDEVALSKLFCRIDANGDGTVDWDEFSSYMLLESAGSASIRELETAIDLMPPVAHETPEQHLHTDLITHVSRVELANGTDRYISCSKDGTVKVWNCKDLKHMRTINTGKSYVTCAKLLPHTFKLAVSSFSRSMKIYDLNTYELCGQIQEIDYAPMSMDVWLPRLGKESEMVVFGDGGGFVRLYELRVNPLEDKNSNDRYLDTPIWKHQHHSDWVTCVRYVEDLNCVIAGSLDKLISITDAEERVRLKVLDGHLKGVTSVDWSPIYKFVCSGAQDRKIILWNPFSQRPLAQLTGHATSVQQVLVNDKDNQIISLGSDKTVKVWDIRNHKCLQTLLDREPYKIDNTLLTMAFDHRRKQLLTGNIKVKTWKQIVTTSHSSGHREPVTKAIYNPIFNEAVSGDHAGTVSVWYVPTGKLRFRFYNAHKNHRITAMTFDIAYRRLITGADNGEVKIWNFSSGACITQLHPPAASLQEVTCVLTVRGSLTKSIIVAGWDRKVTFYEDSGLRDSHPSGRCFKGHESDVLDMAIMDKYPSLVTACDDGCIWSWNLDSGAPRHKMWPKGMDTRPVNERAVEAVKFMHGKMRHVLVAVYADRFMRFWDVHMGNCLHQVFTGHKTGETVMSLAVDPSDQCIATGDSAGYIKIWNTANFSVKINGAASGEVSEVCLWRGHDGQISSLEWIEIPEKRGRFLMSASHDHEIKLWSDKGIQVGVFGIGSWDLENPSTWKETAVLPMQPVEDYDMEMSRKIPDDTFAPTSPSVIRMSKQYSFMQDDQSSQRPPSAPDSVSKVLRASHRERVVRVESLRSASSRMSSMRMGSRPGTADGFFPASRPGSRPGTSEKMGSISLAAAEEDWADDFEEEVQEEIEDLESSSGHDSDGDIPVALWLEEFDAARKTKGASEALRSTNKAGGVSHKPVYAPPKGVSDLAKLPDRPVTSYTRRGK